MNRQRAIEAWNQLKPEGPAPTRASALSKKSKSAVYRLAGTDGDRAVIAKCCGRETALLERRLYEEVLAHLPINYLRFHGCVEEAGAEECWLFLEEATGEKYSSLVEENRHLSARWLALVHTSAARLADSVSLPERGADYYLELLQTVRQTTGGRLRNPLFRPLDLEMLARIASCCDAIESRWDKLRALCDLIPRTLVHGDLSPKNVQVRSEGADSTLLPFDWENAGWGVPAADMAQLLIPPRDHLSLRPDLEAYWVVAKEAWPQLTTAEVRQVGALGTLFRLIALMSWASSGLSEKRPQKTVRTLRFYEPAFATALDEALA